LTARNRRGGLCCRAAARAGDKDDDITAIFVAAATVLSVADLTD